MCALLAWAGVGKLRQPAATRVAAREIGLPSSRAAVRALGVVELGAAIAGAVFGGIAAALVAGLYVGLTVASARLLRRAPGTPCGCLGASTAPASRAHVIVNAAAVVVSVSAAALGGSPLARAAASPLGGMPLFVLAALTAWLAALTIDARPGLARATREGSR